MVRLSLAMFSVWVALGCQMTPEEINRIQTENELLREEIRIIRQNCGYYRDLQLEVEEGTEAQE
jgi:hypothetical protein